MYVTSLRTSHLRLLRTLLRSGPWSWSCSPLCSSSWPKVIPEPPCIICISCIWSGEVNSSLCCWVLFMAHFQDLAFPSSVPITSLLLFTFCQELFGAPRGLFPPLIFPLSFFFGGEILHLKSSEVFRMTELDLPTKTAEPHKQIY